ncbi:MAG: ABC transporter permease [Oscillospiraceae bacterium]
MKYIIKNLNNFLKEEKIIFLLIILCSFIAAIVIYFTYGIGYNFLTQKNIGETSSYELRIQYNELVKAKSEQNINYKDIADNADYFTFRELKSLLSELDSDVFINCNNIYTDIVYNDDYTTVTFPESGGMVTDYISLIDLKFLYDKGTNLFSITKGMEQLYNPYSYSYSLVDGYGFTNDDFINSNKKAVVGVGIFNDLYVDGKGKTEFGYVASYDGEFSDINNKDVIINDIRYKISGISSDNSISVPISSLDDNTKIATFFPELLTFCYDLPVTHEQYTRTQNLIQDKYGDILSVKEIEFIKKDKPFFNLMLIITVFVALTTIINVVIMLRYILIKRKKQLSVFKMCGYSNIKLTRNFICEAMFIIIPSFLIGILVYFYCVKPNITQYFIYINDAYSNRINLLLFSLFSVMSIISLFLMAYKSLVNFSAAKLKETE